MDKPPKPPRKPRQTMRLGRAERETDDPTDKPRPIKPPSTKAKPR